MLLRQTFIFISLNLLVLYVHPRVTSVVENLPCQGDWIWTHLNTCLRLFQRGLTEEGGMWVALCHWIDSRLNKKCVVVWMRTVPRDSHVWTLGLQLAVLLGKVMEPLGRGPSLEEGAGFGGSYPHPTSGLPFLFPLRSWDVISQLPAPATCCLLRQYGLSLWNHKPK